jgi:hypothetical protein
MTTSLNLRVGGSELTNAQIDENFTNLRDTADAALPKAGGEITGDLRVDGDFSIGDVPGGFNPTTGRRYLALKGTGSISQVNSCGILQLAHNYTIDAAGTVIGGIEWHDPKNTSGNTRTGYIAMQTMAGTANNRGAMMTFAIRKDNQSAASEVMRIDDKMQFGFGTSTTGGTTGMPEFARFGDGTRSLVVKFVSAGTDKPAALSLVHGNEWFYSTASGGAAVCWAYSPASYSDADVAAAARLSLDSSGVLTATGEIVGTGMVESRSAGAPSHVWNDTSGGTDSKLFSSVLNASQELELRPLNDIYFYPTANPNLTLKRDGTCLFSYAVTLTGAATMSSTAHIVGAATLDSTLAVTGVATFTAAPVFSNGWTVTAGGATITAGGLTVTAGGATLNGGNLAFGTTAQRITGDMSNVTASSRLIMQSSTVNGNTVAGIAPNGTNKIARQTCFGSSDVDNAPTSQLWIDGTNLIGGMNVAKQGTGTVPDFVVSVSGTVKMRMWQGTANFRIGPTNTDSGDKLQVEGTAKIEGAASATGLGVGVAIASINASALAQFDSTTKGLLPPRVTTTQRNAISSPATGLTVYNTTTLALESYTGSAWAGGGGGSSTPPQDHITGLLITKSATAGKIDISAGHCYVPAASALVDYAGATAVNTGTLGNNQWNQVYIDGAAAITVVNNADAPSTCYYGTARKDGSDRRLIGSFLTDGSAAVLAVVAFESAHGVVDVMSGYGATRILNAGTATSYTSVSATPVPKYVSRFAYCSIYGTSGPSAVNISLDGTNIIGEVQTPGGGGFLAMPAWVPLDPSVPQIYYKVSSGTYPAYMDVYGYRMTR